MTSESQPSGEEIGERSSMVPTRPPTGDRPQSILSTGSAGSCDRHMLVSNPCPSSFLSLFDQIRTYFRTVGRKILTSSMYCRKMAPTDRRRRRYDQRSMDWCRCPTSRWKLYNRATEYGPQLLPCLAVFQLQSCLHDVVGNHKRTP
jgi:hypothetical protein